MSIQPSVLCAGFKFHHGSGAGGIGYIPEQSPTLTADWHNPAVLIGGEPCEATRSACGGCPGGGKGPLIQEEVSGTLATSNDQTIFCMADDNVRAAIDKVLEEAAAPFLRAGFKYSLTGEIADTITACCNLAACEERNRKRGRYGR